MKTKEQRTEWDLMNKSLLLEWGETVTVTQVIENLKTKQNNHVGEWEEYDRLGDIIDEVSSQMKNPLINK